MDTLWLSAPDRQLMLASAATIAAPAALAAEVPEAALRLLFVRSGACRLLLEDGHALLAGDRMALLRAQARYDVDAPTEDLLLSQIDISHTRCPPDGYSLRQLYQHYPDYRQFCQETRTCFAFHDRYALLRFTTDSLDRYASYAPAQRSLPTAATLAYMLLVIASAIYEKQRQPHHYNRHVRRAAEYIHENYMRTLTAADIASYVGIHPGHLHRLFRAETGTRVTEYLTNVRLDKAKTLLKRTDIPIALVASLAGISSQQYLSRLFHQHVGMTPQAYRHSYNITCDYDAARRLYETVDFGRNGEGAL